MKKLKRYSPAIMPLIGFVLSTLFRHNPRLFKQQAGAAGAIGTSSKPDIVNFESGQDLRAVIEQK